MSIVLVIIGLIVGGILKGQEVIDSARQKNLMSMVDQIKAATNTFEDRYRAVPGDLRTAATTINAEVLNGNGDGYLNVIATPAAPLANVAALAGADGVTIANENVFFFQSLVAANLFGGGQVFDNAAAPTNFSQSGILSPLPMTPFNGAGMTVAHGTHQGTATAGSGNTELLAVWLRTHTWAAAAPANTNLPFKAATAHQIDLKFDDGLPATGRIRNMSLGTATLCGDETDGNNRYDLTGSAGIPECDVMFALD